MTISLALLPDIEKSSSSCTTSALGFAASEVPPPLVASFSSLLVFSLACMSANDGWGWLAGVFVTVATGGTIPFFLFSGAKIQQMQ
jgi:hypothetical protein